MGVPMASANCRTYSDYSIGWMCSLDAALDAARVALDEIHPPLPSLPRDNNVYTFGSIGPHNVVVTSLPSGTYGTVAAAVAATHMQRSFPDLRFGLMVGIGGGVPKITDDPATTKDIRLGDVVVSHPVGSSSGVVQYDLGNTVQGKAWPERVGMLNKPPRVLLNGVKSLRSRYRVEQRSHEDRVAEIVDKHSWLTLRSTYQGAENDVLFKSGSNHKNRNADCRECDVDGRVSRPPRNSNSSVVHYGIIASGNGVVEDSVTRDYWGDAESVLCFETEAAGLMDDFPCIVIRGICSYADSHENKRWQPYAALVAAAYAKDLLLAIAPELDRRTADPFTGQDDDGAYSDSCMYAAVS